MAEFKDVKALFAHEFLTANRIDETLYENIKRFRLNWAQKDEDYIEFLGGRLLGANPIRFSSLDENIFFKDVLNMDRNTLNSDIKITKGIDYRRKVESNPLYLTLVYLMHAYTVGRFSTKVSEDAVKECYFIFAYKTISSLVSHYFSYDADISLLKAVDNRLSGKFLIKQVENWQELFEYRSRDLLKGGLHYRRLEKFTTDDCVRIVIDLQTRIRAIVKNIYAIMIEVKEDNEKVMSSSSLTESEDGVGVIDITNGDDVLIKELNRIMFSERDLINNDLLYLLKSLVKNFDVNEVIDALRYISNNNFPCKKDIAEYTILEGLEGLRIKDIDNFRKNFVEVVKVIKSAFSNSNGAREFKNLKKELDKELSKGLKKTKNWRTALLTLNVLIYLFMRAIIATKK